MVKKIVKLLILAAVVAAAAERVRSEVGAIRFDKQQLVRLVRKDKIGQDLHGRRLFFGRVMGEILADFEEYIIIYHFLRNNFGNKGSVLNILF